jgi:recombination protein RecT
MENTTIDVARALGLDQKAFELGKLIHYIGEDALDRAYKEALERNPKLAQCTPDSLIGALLKVVQLGLGPDHVSLVPLKDKNAPVLITTEEMYDQTGYVCHFQLTYKGYLELSRRCGGESEKSA